MIFSTRKRCDITQMADQALTEQWYADLPQEQGLHIMQGIISHIVGKPLDYSKGAICGDYAYNRCHLHVISIVASAAEDGLK